VHMQHLLELVIEVCFVFLKSKFMERSMLSKFVVFLLVLSTCGGTLVSFLIADEFNSLPEVVKKYNLSICAVFKNKANDLKEWIEYHRILGVDHFYLYNLSSGDFYQAVLNGYIHEGIVTFVNWPDLVGQVASNADVWSLMNAQIPAYENAVNFLARDETKWLVFLDINEFLGCPHSNIAELLEEYDNCGSISLCSDVFVRAERRTSSKNKFNSQSLENWRSQDLQKANQQVAKMIFKPDLCVGFVCPPYECRLKPNQSSLKMDSHKLRIIRYINENTFNLPIEKKNTFVQDGDYQSISAEEAPSFWSEEYVGQNQNVSVYERVPDFLRRLQSASLDIP
jgi:hypothetical protein